MAQLNRNSGKKRRTRFDWSRFSLSHIIQQSGFGGRHAVVFAGCLLLLVLLVVLFTSIGRQSGVAINRHEKSATNHTATTQTTPAATTSSSSTTEAPASSIVVHVDGAVAHPGVYELNHSAPRVRDAIDAAGGLVKGADTSELNLAASVADGDKIFVSKQGEAPSSHKASKTTCDTSSRSASPKKSSKSSESSKSSRSAKSSKSSRSSKSSKSSRSSKSSKSEKPRGKVNLNTATSEELTTVVGIGTSTAASIIEERTQNGPFTSVDDLQRVSGIGKKKLEKIRQHVRV